MARRKWRMLVAGVLLVALAVAAWRIWVAVEAPRFHPLAVTPVPGALAPRAAWVAPRDTHLLGMAWSADGERLYAYLQVGALNLWPVLVGFWPELALAILAPIAVMVVRRVVRRPGSSGLHCRRCGYAVAHLESDRCPECGLELTSSNRVRGMPRRRKVAAGAGVGLGLFVGYALAATLAPRVNRVTSWLDWSSTALYDLAYHADSFVGGMAVAHKIEVYWVVELDPETGRIRRTLLRQTDDLRPWNRMAISRDGSLLGVAAGESLWVIDAGSGERRHEFRAPPSSTAGGFNFFNAVACSPEGRYVHAADWNGTLFKWDAATGELLEKTPVGSILGEQVPDGPAVVRAIELPPDGLGPTLSVSFPGDEPQTRILCTDARLRLASSRIVRPATLTNRVNDLVLSVIDSRRARWYGLEMQGDLLVVDLELDAPAGRHALPGNMSFGLGISPDGGVLGIGRMDTGQWKGIVELYSTGPPARLARLGDDNFACRVFAFTRDGSRVACGGWCWPSEGSQAGAITIHDVAERPE